MELNRSVYDRRDYRHGGSNGAARNAVKLRIARSNVAEEWGYGLMGIYSSGFTQGTIGLGLDAYGYCRLKLDSGGGRAGTARLLSMDNDGHPKDNYGRAGAAMKLRYSSSFFKYGVQRIKTPVFGSSDSRLLPETATGWWSIIELRDDLTINGGHFTESTDRNGSSHNDRFVINYSNGRQGATFDLVGVYYTGQMRYDLAMAAYGIPGLSFSAAYVRGDGIDGRKVDPNGGTPT